MPAGRQTFGGQWSAAEWTGGQQREQVPSEIISEWGTEPTVSTVRFSVPRSDSLATSSLFFARRAMCGGTWSRGWVAFDHGGATRALGIYHDGQGADPTTWVPTLSGATHIPVTLGSGNQTSAQNAATLIAALAGAGISATTDGTNDDGDTIVVVSGASNLQLPPPVDTTDTARRGMYGLQRDDWGAGVVTQNLTGGTGGTGSIHIGNPGAALSSGGRILGVYMWGRSGYQPRLGVATGPAYSLTPGAMTLLDEGVLPSGLSDFDVVLFPEPVAFSSSDELWALYRENVGGGPRYRNHGQTPVGSGDLTVGERLIWDTTSDANAATEFGTLGVYTPTVDATFTIYIAIGVIFEIPDASGNYPSDGRVYLRIGDQNDDPAHGTQFLAGPALLNPEKTMHRGRFSVLSRMPVTAIRRAVGAIASYEDSRPAFHGPWATLAFPASPAPALIADCGIMGLAGNANVYTTYALPTPVELGSDDVGVGAITSLAFNYVRDGGGAIDTYQLPVFLDVSIGDGSWLNAWVDDRENWHDDIPGATGNAGLGTSLGYTSGVSEYRIRDPAAGPSDDWTDTWESTLVTGTTPADDSPNAIALDTYWVDRPGVQVA